MSDVARDDKGRFPAGVSGNPAGRPPSTKNKITELKQNLELAVRKNVKASDIQEIVEAMIKEAKNGSIGAARLILDKVLPNAKDVDDVTDGGQTFVFRVENVTVQAQQHTPEPAPIEGEYTNVEEPNG